MSDTHQTEDLSHINSTLLGMLIAVLIVLLFLTYIGVEAYVLAEKNAVEATAISQQSVELQKLVQDQQVTLEGQYVERVRTESGVEVRKTRAVGKPIDQAIQEFVREVNAKRAASLQ